jgi:hypothetical protein
MFCGGYDFRWQRVIPINQDLWIFHDLVQNKYKIKVQIALKLISRVKKLV